MPTYEYACTSCGHHVEVYQRFSDAPLTDCGVCGGQLRKVFHPAGILFKGSGFYATDSRTNAKSHGDGSKKPTADAKPSEKAAPSSTKSSDSSSAASGSDQKSA